MKNADARLWTVQSLLADGLLHSNPNHDLTAPSVPTGLAVGQVTETTIQISWSASTDDGSGLITYDVEADGVDVADVLSPTSYVLTDLSALQTVEFRVRARDRFGNVSDWSAIVEGTTAAASGASAGWAAQAADSRIHVIPGVNFYGSDSPGGSGRAPDSTGVDIVLITSNALGNTGQAVAGLGSNVFEGTYEFAWRFNGGAGRSKIIIDTISGRVPIEKQFNAGVVNGLSYYGQFAPGPGKYATGISLAMGLNSNVQIWHAGLYSTNTQANDNNRDPIAFGLGTGSVSNIALINCETGWNQDENVDFFRSHDNVGLIYHTFAPSFHVHENGIPNGSETGFGPIFGGSGSVSDRVSISRSLLAHHAVRGPKINARRAYLENNLYYNFARRQTGSQGVLIDVFNQAGDTTPLRMNAVRCLNVRGPDCVSTMSRNQVSSGWTYPVGSGCFMEGWAQNGWTAPANQAAFWSSLQTNFTLPASVMTQALPSGRLSDLSDTTAISATPLSPTTPELITFLNRIGLSVGPKPGMRVLNVGRTARILLQILARLNGTTGEGTQMADNPTEDGGLWTPPDPILVNPANPGTHWHAPMPTAADRHTPLASGTFSNGASCVGYTPMEVWAIEQHWYVGGQ